MNNILEITKLSKSYKDFQLKDISFSLSTDCIVGFIGVNGAGKTTTIKTILGLGGKTSGSIKVFGKEISQSEQKFKDRIGVVLDGDCFYDHLSMLEMKNIIAPAYSKWSEKDFNEYMARFSLNPKQKIATLSKGMRMKFAVALALSHDADLLIMDEPTSGLDPLIRSQLLEIMTDYMKKGEKSIFFSTHITSDLDKVADILILIDKGKIIFQHDKDMLIETHRVIKGDSRELTDDVKKLFLNLQITDFGFVGITNKVLEVKNSIKDILIEKPTMEDIMLAYIEGGEGL